MDPKLFSSDTVFSSDSSDILGLAPNLSEDLVEGVIDQPQLDFELKTYIHECMRTYFTYVQVSENERPFSDGKRTSGRTEKSIQSCII